MCAEKTEQEIEDYQSSRFEKAFKRLNKDEQGNVDEEIDSITFGLHSLAPGVITTAGAKRNS